MSRRSSLDSFSFQWSPPSGPRCRERRTVGVVRSSRRDPKHADGLFDVLQPVLAEVLDGERLAEAPSSFGTDDDGVTLTEGGQACREVRDRTRRGICPARARGALDLGGADPGHARVHADVELERLRRYPLAIDLGRPAQN